MGVEARQAPTGVTPAASAKAEVILRGTDLHRTFRMGDSEVPVLKGAEITLRRGEFVAIEGRSGSGKSTLLHILGALDAVDGGNVSFKGEDYTRRRVAEKSLPFWRRWMGSAVFLVVLLIAALAGLIALLWAGWPALAVAGLALAMLIGAAVWFVYRDPLDRKSAKLRNREFGFVFQFYYLLPELNVLENTLVSSMVEHSWLRYFSARAELRARARRILEDLGLSHRLTHRPSQLSGGERQRVAIARALMNEPKILFADEPTGNLDYETGRQIMNVLETLHREKGQTIVMVTHDRALAREADRVLVLKGGKLEKAE